MVTGYPPNHGPLTCSATSDLHHFMTSMLAFAFSISVQMGLVQATRPEDIHIATRTHFLLNARSFHTTATGRHEVSAVLFRGRIRVWVFISRLSKRHMASTIIRTAGWTGRRSAWEVPVPNGSVVVKDSLFVARWADWLQIRFSRGPQLPVPD